MPSQRTAKALTFCVVGVLCAALAGCNLFSNDRDQRTRDEKTRDEVAKATEKAKPILQEAGKDLQQAAKVAADEAHAVAEGVKEGWEHGDKPLLDLNSATESQLVALPGITPRQTRRIIAARPYRDAHDLVRKGILTEDGYAKIRDLTTAK